MEAAGYYQQFERNVKIILDALDAGLDVRTTHLNTSLPIEVYVLCEVLNQGGENFRLTTQGLDLLREFAAQYLQHDSATEATMRRILEDKKSMMRTPEGRVLTKEMLIRRLEFFNEAARLVNVMRTQHALGSPPQSRSGNGLALQK
ncbi:hypothetical protein HMJ29_03495 [Hymenobacter taeanensis]|uniref:Uncharacterized protein n=1 Tax=Hymenobacter taeanensis TaxID=2735321 RepID=A0A6M6BCA8_9BACT|nr:MULTISPECIES: hypothetical protein [Hymenobacter]QJX46051.1 hypothetical protein HMJ29_03495 [Hymenobacter taeanensis]UOQ79905.1 hypothetical protein MUN83_13750 [Hymenobacter sp. 5414T-23]